MLTFEELLEEQHRQVMVQRAKDEIAQKKQKLKTFLEGQKRLQENPILREIYETD